MDDCAELLITDAAGLAACCAHLARVAQVGLDTEFVGEDSYHPKICLVQLATEETLYLVDPFAFTDEELRPLWDLLIDARGWSWSTRGARRCGCAIARSGGRRATCSIYKSRRGWSAWSIRSATARLSARCCTNGWPRARRSPNGGRGR